jgi:hypothetical protein
MKVYILAAVRRVINHGGSQSSSGRRCDKNIIVHFELGMSFLLYCNNLTLCIFYI